MFAFFERLTYFCYSQTSVSLFVVCICIDSILQIFVWLAFFCAVLVRVTCSMISFMIRLPLVMNRMVWVSFCFSLPIVCAPFIVAFIILYQQYYINNYWYVNSPYELQKLVRLFCRYKEKINSIGVNHKTPLTFLCNHKHVTYELVDELLTKGADPNYREIVENQITPLHAICKNFKATLRIVKLLVQSGAKVDALDFHKNNPLHYICRTGGSRDKIIKFLIKNGCEVNSKNDKDVMPIHMALSSRMFVISTLYALLTSGANVNDVDKYGDSPLHIACKNRLVGKDAIELLLEYGANFNLKTKDGLTPYKLVEKHRRDKRDKHEILDIIKKYSF